MKNKKIKCDIYTRVSTTMQVDGYSLDAQKEKLKRYAEFQNMEIVNEYSDEGKSGKSVEGRPEFQRMLDNIENGTDEVQFVLVFKLSRFGRNAADVLNSLQRMQDFGVNLICVEDGIDSSKDSGKMMHNAKKWVMESCIRHGFEQVDLLTKKHRDNYWVEKRLMNKNASDGVGITSNRELIRKDYITSIVANVKAIEKTSNDVRVQQETLKQHNEKLANQQNKLDAHQVKIEKNVANK